MGIVKDNQSIVKELSKCLGCYKTVIRSILGARLCATTKVWSWLSTRANNPIFNVSEQESCYPLPN